MTKITKARAVVEAAAAAAAAADPESLRIAARADRSTARPSCGHLLPKAPQLGCMLGPETA